VDRLVVLNDVDEAKGGATSLALASALAMRARGIDVTYITSEGEGARDLLEAGVEVVRIRGSVVSPQSRAEGMLVGLYRKSAGNAVQEWIARRDTPRTVYHVHTWTRFLSPAVIAALSPVAHRAAITAHDFFLTCPNGAQYSFSEQSVCKRVANSPSCLTHHCDQRSYADKLWRSARHGITTFIGGSTLQRMRVIAIHDAMLPVLIHGGLPEKNLTVIRNPLRPFHPTRAKVEDNRDVLFIGRLKHEKGPDLAAEAAARAGVGIKFVGIGPMETELKRRWPNAELLGWKNHAQIAELSSTSRMLVMPSRWAEPYGMVAGEALWSGLPVIASKKAYLADEVAAAGAGLSVDTDDVDAFASSIRAIASDDVLAKSMSERAHTATRHLGNTLADWEKKHEALYEQML
jgi:glycosyltransferase involved in cell wall biosynthesis